MQIAELIEQKIFEGKIILAGLASMRERSGMAINVTYYFSEDVESAKRKINKWQLTTKDILINGLGETHRYVTEFIETITDKNSGFNYRREFESEMNHGLSVLEGLSESLKLGLVGPNTNNDDKPAGAKPPLVFISHAELDKDFANEIVTLIEFIGVKAILCTSVDGYRIPLGHDIIEYLREQFSNYNLFVIILHTHNYYMSPFCLNEMGAAWALKTKYFSVLASDFGFEEMTGVVNNKDVAIKIDADDCEARLNQLKNELVDFFKLFKPNEDRWPHYRSKFIKNCLKFKTAKIQSKNDQTASEKPKANSLIVLSKSFKLFSEDKGRYPCQIDIKFAAQEEDVYFKTITLSNKKHGVEIEGHNVENDVMKIVCYLKANTLNIEKGKRAEYTDKVEAIYNTDSFYIEDHKLPKNALETMSFHGVISQRRQMDGYDDLPLKDWNLRVTYNVDGELVIPLKAIII